jgi:hypothetical protein
MTDSRTNNIRLTDWDDIDSPTEIFPTDQTPTSPLLSNPDLSTVFKVITDPMCPPGSAFIMNPGDVGTFTQTFPPLDASEFDRAFKTIYADAHKKFGVDRHVSAARLAGTGAQQARLREEAAKDLTQWYDEDEKILHTLQGGRHLCAQAEGERVITTQDMDKALKAVYGDHQLDALVYDQNPFFKMARRAGKTTAATRFIRAMEQEVGGAVRDLKRMNEVPLWKDAQPGKWAGPSWLDMDEVMPTLIEQEYFEEPEDAWEWAEEVKKEWRAA